MSEAPVTQPLDRERLDFVLEAIEHEGQPYVWGAKGPDRFDCSGLVTYCLWRATHGRLDWRETHNADRLYRELQALGPDEQPTAGDLVFYGSPDAVNHVMVWMGGDRVYGASGGNHHTTSPEIAAKTGARVKYRSPVEYRPDFVGIRRAPVDPLHQEKPNGA